MIQNLVHHLYPCDNDRTLLKVNLEQDFNFFSFELHYPDKKDKIASIFKKFIVNENVATSVSSILQSLELCDGHLNLLQSLNFKQLTRHPKRGIILEHPELPGLLIKKNYTFQRDENDNLERHFKVVRGSNFPSWMLPKHLQMSTSVNIVVPNDYINPLRVVMLKRGRHVIKKFKLTHIKAAKEYLYLLPGADPSKPLYQRAVVISEKENVLSTQESLLRYAAVAKKSPDKLAEIAKQIVLFIKHVKLTDSHLNNFPFLNDETDVVVALDGEPIGGLADTSDPKLVRAVQEFDPGFWSLLGLKKLQISITEQMKAEKIAPEDTQRVQDIFDHAIDSAIPEIIKERQLKLIKLQAYESLLVFNVTSYILQSAFNFVDPISYLS